MELIFLENDMDHNYQNIQILLLVIQKFYDKLKQTFDTGIQQTIQWYLDNKEWWQNILSGEYQNYFEKMYAGKIK